MRYGGTTTAALLALATVLLLGSAEPEPSYAFTLPELYSGEDLSFSELTATQPLVVYLWGIDCPYCLAHLPYVAALLEKLDLAQCGFVLLSVDDKPQEIQDYLAERELQPPVCIIDPNEEGRTYGEHGWPATFVFAPGGELEGISTMRGPRYITEVLDLVEQAAGGQ